METPQYVTGKKACETLGVHVRTLYQWDAKGWIKTIRTPGNHRMYNVKQYLDERGLIQDAEKQPDEPTDERLKVIYVRVSSHGQKDDLERQKNLLMKRYPDHLVVEDIGSGMNMNRRGFRRMIDWIIQGRLEEVVIAHKDRLARFGYELFEDLLSKYSNGHILEAEQIKDRAPEEELVQDVLQVMNIFVAKMNGMRKYKVL